jgi:hypothetical protein
VSVRGVSLYEDEDSADPALVETEAGYLERHGLLLPGERRRLTEVDFKPVPATDWGGDQDGDDDPPPGAALPPREAA